MPAMQEDEWYNKPSAPVYGPTSGGPAPTGSFSSFGIGPGAAQAKPKSRSSRSSRGSGYNNRNRGGSGGYSRGSSGGMGSSPTGTITKTPPPMTPQQFLAKDSTYLNQQKAYQQALADYAAQYQAELGKYGNEYTSGVDKVGQERTQGLQGLKDDYASRGMITSGVYGEAVGKYNTDIDTRLADMLRGKQAYENDLATGKSNFTKEQQALLDKAKQDALNRQLAGM